MAKICLFVIENIRTWITETEEINNVYFLSLSNASTITKKEKVKR